MFPEFSLTGSVFPGLAAPVTPTGKVVDRLPDRHPGELVVDIPVEVAVEPARPAARALVVDESGGGVVAGGECARCRLVDRRRDPAGIVTVPRGLADMALLRPRSADRRWLGVSGTGHTSVAGSFAMHTYAIPSGARRRWKLMSATQGSPDPDREIGRQSTW